MGLIEILIAVVVGVAVLAGLVALTLTPDRRLRRTQRRRKKAYMERGMAGLPEPRGDSGYDSRT